MSVLMERELDLFSSGHILCIGQTGSAKTNLMQRLAEKFYGEGYKILAFDMKHELCQCGFQEDEPALVSLMADPFALSPRPYPHEVFVPFMVDEFVGSEGGRMVKRLPQHTKEFIDFQKQEFAEVPGYQGGWSEWKPFKLALEDIAAADFVQMLSSVTKSGQNTLKMLMENEKFSNIRGIMQRLVSLLSRESNKQLAVSMTSEKGLEESAEIGNFAVFQSVLSILSAVERSGFICSKTNEYRLQLDAILRDQRTWTTFTFKDASYGLASMAFQAIARQIVGLRLDKRGEMREEFPKLMILLPEASTFMPRQTEHSVLAMAGVSPLAVSLYWLNQSRTLRTRVMADIQDVRQLNPVALGAFKWKNIGLFEDVKALTEVGIKVPDIVRDKLASLETGHWLVLQAGKNKKSKERYHYPCPACPSLCYHKKEGQHVLRWVQRQPGIEMVEYVDVVSDSLRVGIRARPGKKGSKKAKEMDAKVAKAHVLRQAGKKLSEIAVVLRVSEKTVQRYLDKDVEQTPGQEAVSA